jgi:hypothetical protein
MKITIYSHHKITNGLKRLFEFSYYYLQKKAWSLPVSEVAQ